MNTRLLKDYLTKIYAHPQDRDTYRPLSYNRTSAIVNDTCTIIEHIHSQHITDKATAEFLLPPKNTRTDIFYGLPKIHRPDCPLELIVSCCDGPTDYLSISHPLHPAPSLQPPMMRQRHKTFSHPENLLPLSPNAILVTADVTSLYTNIPHKEGIAAVIHFMEEYKHLLPTNSPLLHIVWIILNFILKHSTFKFMDTQINQILGTSMGTRMDPPYSNLFMGKEKCTIILTFFHLT